MDTYKITTTYSNNTKKDVYLRIPASVGTYRLLTNFNDGSRSPCEIEVSSSKSNYRMLLTGNGENIEFNFSTLARNSLYYSSVANLKMNQTFDDVAQYIKYCMKAPSSTTDTFGDTQPNAILQTELILCPQTCLLPVYKDEIVNQKKSYIKLAAQLASPFEQGAYTGQNSIDALISVGVDYILVNHSDHYMYGQTLYQHVSVTIDIALQAIYKGCIPIICIGEQLNDDTELANQVETYILPIIKNSSDPRQFLVCYEPVWSIGTGVGITSNEISNKIMVIREKMREYYGNSADIPKVIYGGSVTISKFTANAIREINYNLFNPECLDGILVGGASLKPADMYELSMIVNDQKK